MKKTTKTTVKKYDKDGKLLEHTETTVEEETKSNEYVYNPYITPSKPYTPYVGDVPDMYTKTGGKSITVTY